MRPSPNSPPSPARSFRRRLPLQGPSTRGPLGLFRGFLIRASLPPRAFLRRLIGLHWRVCFQAAPRRALGRQCGTSRSTGAASQLTARGRSPGPSFPRLPPAKGSQDGTAPSARVTSCVGRRAVTQGCCRGTPPGAPASPSPPEPRARRRGRRGRRATDSRAEGGRADGRRGRAGASGAASAMVLIKEYRVVLPVSVEEYQVGQLYSVAEASKNETGGGEGVEVLVNEPYERDGERGQFTHKIYHLQSKVPPFVRMLAPEGALDIHEKAWNAYPFCRTVITNEYMKDDFLIKIETWHKADTGMQENVHKLDPEEWKNVEAVYIDIGDRSHVLSRDYKPEEDPAKFKSVKTGRGPLGPNWKKELGKQAECPYMCAYKLVTVKFKWWGLQNKIENFIQKQERRLFTNFHRQLFCWLDKWVDLTMEDIRRMEDETKRQLDEMRERDPLKGMSASDE